MARKTFVNLDALLPREDFDVYEEHDSIPSQLGDTLTISELEEGKFTFLALRKPDFQRETSNWSPQHVVDFIKSFVEGDLIPAVILWRSPESNNLFVIDGAHRLSALIAWVRDDYGDKDISRKFYENRLSEEQISAAEETRSLVKEQVGSHSELRAAIQFPENSSAELVKKARGLGVLALPLQWVRGDAKKAEESFLRINQKPTSIDTTELLIIQHRRKPPAVAARAVVRAGVGHKYWAGFTEQNQSTTEMLAKELHRMFFEPPIKTPLRTIDLPMAGQGYSPAALRLVFEFIAAANDTKTPTKLKQLEDDLNGTETIKFLRNSRKIASLISSKDPGSLGLHPAVYFYGATGLYVPAAFLAVQVFLSELNEANNLDKFILVRKRFEDFLVNRSYFINAIVSEKGSGARSVPFIAKMYRLLYSELLADPSSSESSLIKAMQNDGLRMLKQNNSVTRGEGSFSGPAKVAAVLNEALSSASCCSECGARLHVEKAITVDHKVRVEDGGSSHSDNAQLTHPFCNSGIKEKRVSIAKELKE